MNSSRPIRSGLNHSLIDSVNMFYSSNYLNEPSQVVLMESVSNCHLEF